MSDIYMQFSNCIPISGHTRGCIYDIQTGNYFLVDKEIVKLIIDNNFNLNEEYFSFCRYLESKGCGIFLDENIAKSFPSISLAWESPSTICNCIIKYQDVDLENIAIEELILALEQLLCKDIFLVFTNLIKKSQLIEFLSRFKSSHINSIVIFLNGGIRSLKRELSFQQRISSIVHYNSEDKKPKKDENEFYTSKNLSDLFDVAILEENFVVNVPLFTESQLHNTYFNRKLAIDENGFIKNSPELPWHYGNVADIEIAEAIKDEGTDPDFFKKYALYLQAQSEGEEYVLDFEVSKPAFNALYFIHKEMIDVCKECEFRHMCVDACTPVQRADDSWYRSVECNYNPYICKWEGEEGYKTLAESGVVCNQQGFSINHDKIAALNEILWAD